jgi:hypothetical protein
MKKSEFMRAIEIKLEQANKDAAQSRLNATPSINYAPYFEGIIVELNDIARWSREEIAAWLRSIGL